MSRYFMCAEKGPRSHSIRVPGQRLFNFEKYGSGKRPTIIVGTVITQIVLKAAREGVLVETDSQGRLLNKPVVPYQNRAGQPLSHTRYDPKRSRSVPTDVPADTPPPVNTRPVEVPVKQVNKIPADVAGQDLNDDPEIAEQERRRQARQSEQSTGYKINQSENEELGVV